MVVEGVMAVNVAGFVAYGVAMGVWCCRYSSTVVGGVRWCDWS